MPVLIIHIHGPNESDDLITGCLSAQLLSHGNSNVRAGSLMTILMALITTFYSTLIDRILLP